MGTVGDVHGRIAVIGHCRNMTYVIVINHENVLSKYISSEICLWFGSGATSPSTTCHLLFASFT